MRCSIRYSLAAMLLIVSVGRVEAGAIFSAHGWKWQDIMSNMGMGAIRDAGDPAVQISPHQSSCSGGYGNGYDPYD